MAQLDPTTMLRTHRRIEGISAVLLPFANGDIDWTGFETHVRRTADAGLVPAVNMDTGYVNLLTPEQRAEVLARTRGLLDGSPFVAGAYVSDEPGAGLDVDGYREALDAIVIEGGTPVVFPSFGLAGAGDIAAALARVAADVDRFIAFELSPVFHPAGRVWDLDTYRCVLELPSCIGAKHSSLDRGQEWERLRVRDEVRPEFKVFTGNDLAIDMVMYGSDYLLGLSTFAPDLFARRDQYWLAGDPAFFGLNDALQHLGNIAFRSPVPAYRHDAALFLQLRDWIGTDETPPGCPRRPPWEVELLRDAACRLEIG